MFGFGQKIISQQISGELNKTMDELEVGLA